MLSRRGDFMIGMVLATVLGLFGLQQYFSMRYAVREEIEQRYALEELASVGKSIQDYLYANRRKFFTNANFQRPTGTAQSVFVLSNANFNTFCQNELKGYLRGNVYVPLNSANNKQDLYTQRNIWGDAYKMIVIRRENTAKTVAGKDTRDTDQITVYVVATGGTKKRHSTATVDGTKWVSSGMRKAVLRGGPSFAYVRRNSSGKSELFNTLMTTTAGMDASGAQEGDLAYVAVINLDDTMSDPGLLRQKTGVSSVAGENFDDQPNTMHADIDMSDRNILRVKHLSSWAIDASNIKFNAILYDTEQDAEDSCRNNWLYIMDKSNTKLRVDASGVARRVSDNAIVGRYGMNDKNENIDNDGRLYYISPTQFRRIGAGSDTTVNRLNTTANMQHISAVRPRLAICRKINGQKSLAYLGDNRAEDKVAFVVTAVDGDYIPPYYCPGQDVNVQGGGTIPAFSGPTGATQRVTSTDGSPTFGNNTPATGNMFASGSNVANANNGIRPRLFVIPQIVNTGPDAYPLQGVRAFAENRAEGGWTIRLNALVDVNSKTSFWTGNYQSGSDATDFTSTTAKFKTLRQLNKDTSGSYKYASEGGYLNYLRAVVIGVCSGKLQTF